MVGQFALAVAITTPILLFAGLALRTVQATDARDDYTFGEYLALRILTTLAALVLLALVVAIAALDDTTRWCIVAVGLAKAVESFSDLLHGVWQRHERMDLIGRSQILRGLVSLLTATVLLYVTDSVVWASLGLVVCAAATLVGYDVPITRRVAAGHDLGSTPFLRPNWNRLRIEQLWWLTMPLGLTVLLGALVANIPRYAVEWSLGTADLGIFAALAWFTTAGNMVVNSLAHTAQPRLSRLHAEANLGAFRGLLLRLLTFAGALAIGAVSVAGWLGEIILDFVYGPNYAAQSDVFLWLVVALGLSFVVCFLDTALYAARRFVVQVPINLAVALLSAMACAVYVPRYGLHGAAGVVLGGTLVQVLARVVPVWQTANSSRETRSECLLGVAGERQAVTP